MDGRTEGRKTKCDQNRLNFIAQSKKYIYYSERTKLPQRNVIWFQMKIQFLTGKLKTIFTRHDLVASNE